MEQATTQYFDTSTLIDMFGVESYAEASKNSAVSKKSSMTLGTLRRSYDADSMNKLKLLINQFLPEEPKSHTMSQEDKMNAYNTEASINLEAAAREVITDKALYKFLPTELTRVIDKLKAPMTALESKMSSIADPASDEYFACKWKRDRYRNAMESIIFNNLSGAYKQMQAEQLGVEGVGTPYQAVFYPVFETAVQYANVAGTIYNKVCKVKQLLNEITSIPVHTKRIFAVFFDKDTRQEIRRVPREKLYSRFDVSKFAPEAYEDFDLDVKITKAQFNKVIKLRETQIPSLGNKPILGALEEVRSDFRVMDLVIGTTTPKNIAELYDYRSGLAMADAVNEVDRKGKIIPFAVDPAKPDDLNYIGFVFNNVERTLSIVCTTSGAAEEVEEMTIRFHRFNANMINKPTMEMTAYEEQHFINAGTPVEYHIPINNNAFSYINSRQAGDYLNQIVNLTAEYASHQKESLFFKEFVSMYDDLKGRQADEELSALDLFAERYADMNILNTNRKVEYINLVLAPQFDNLIQGLSIKANSGIDPQVNFFCHKATLPVINPALKVITGEVNQDTNGKFLGVKQEAETRIITMGSDATSAVHSIVVATNKEDIKHKSTDANGKNIPVGNIQFPLYGIPYFQEANLETVLFTETATRITNTADVRSLNNITVPAMIMESNIGFAKLRPAAAKIVISGYHTAPSVR